MSEARDFYYAEKGSNANAERFRAAARESFARAGLPVEKVRFDQHGDCAIALLTVGDE